MISETTGFNRMALILALLYCFVICLQMQCVAASDNDAQSHSCYSRFDYESKMLERIVMVEHRMTLLQESTRQELVDFKAAKEEMVKEMKLLTKHLRSQQYERQEEMATELKLLSEEVQNTTSAKLGELTDIGKSLQDTASQLKEGQRVKHVQIESEVNNMTSTLQGELLNKQEELINNLTAFGKALEEKNNEKLQEMTNTIRDVKDLGERLKEEQSLKLETVEIIGNEIKVEIQEKMLKLETEDRIQEQNYNSTLEAFRQTVNSTWANIKAEGLDLKPDVVFHFMDPSHRSLSGGQTVLFVTELVNTDQVYSPDKGYFTVPVNGTYMFSIQICGLTKQTANFRLYANDVTLLADASMYDYDTDKTCTTSNAVALLQKGDTVCAKAGPNGLYIKSEEGGRSAFMGILVH